MARDRISLHRKLQKFVDKTRLHFEPPYGFQLSYPCVIYHQVRYENDHADNLTYTSSNVYRVTVIDKNPDSILAQKMVDELQFTRMVSIFTKDNLKHSIFEIKY